MPAVWFSELSPDSSRRRMAWFSHRQLFNNLIFAGDCCLVQHPGDDGIWSNCCHGTCLTSPASEWNFSFIDDFYTNSLKNTVDYTAAAFPTFHTNNCPWIEWETHQVAEDYWCSYSWKEGSEFCMMLMLRLGRGNIIGRLNGFVMVNWFSSEVINNDNIVKICSVVLEMDHVWGKELAWDSRLVCLSGASESPCWLIVWVLSTLQRANKWKSMKEWKALSKGQKKERWQKEQRTSGAHETNDWIVTFSSGTIVPPRKFLSE